MNRKSKRKVALVLSGGGSRGAYEVGVWQALTELGIEIDMVTGTSVGAINSAMVTQGNLELTAQLWKDLETHMIFDVPEGSQPIEYAKEIVFNHGAGSSGLKELMTKYIDEKTIRNSPMDYGIVVVELPTFEGHYVFKEDIPEGQLIDYIMASASVFPAIHSYPIDGKEYIDGGYADILPVKMAMDKGATDIIAVDLNGVGARNREAIKNAPNLTLIQSGWSLGNVLIFDMDNTKRLLRLGYLDAMKAFGVLDGNLFAFARGTFDKTTTKMADACAKVFEMDATLIYTRERFLEKLDEKLSTIDFDKPEILLGKPIESLNLLASKDLLKELKSIKSNHALAFFIAQNLKEKGADSIFIKKTAVRLMPEHVMAARFLVKFNLI